MVRAARTRRRRVRSPGAERKKESRGVGLVRGVLAQPVVEGSLRDAALLGVVTLGGMLGLAEVVQGAEDVGPRPAERDLAGLFNGSRLIGKHGSVPGVASWPSHFREASLARSGGGSPRPFFSVQTANCRPDQSALTQSKDTAEQPKHWLYRRRRKTDR